MIGFVQGFASANGNSTEITDDLTSSKEPTSISSNENITETVTGKIIETNNIDDKTTEQIIKETSEPMPPIRKNPNKPGVRNGTAELNLPDNEISQETYKGSNGRIFDNRHSIEEEYKKGKNGILAQQLKNNIQGEMDRIEGKMDDEFIGEESYALHYFAIFAVSLGLTYLAYYNRRRIIGYLIEGKSTARGGCRYRRLSQSNAANV